MIRSNKKLYYKYFDLMRISSFLYDDLQLSRANANLSIIKDHKETDIVSLSYSELHGVGFDEDTIKEIDEFRETGEILFMKNYVNRIERWIQIILLPDFFNLKMILDVFKKEKISSKEQLLTYFSSQKSKDIYGIEESELYAYFVENMDGSSFPNQYRKKYSINDVVTQMVSGEIIRGNFHNHTPYSDGKCSIAELKNLALLCGRTYIGISDHTKRVQGIDEDAIIRQHHDIDELNKSDDNFIILKSLECEILSNGKLDISDDHLKRCDYIIAAVHTNTRMTKSDATNRVINAIDNTYTNILAHPSSRLYQKNVGLYLDMEKIIDACVANNVALEINGDADRLDLDPRYIKYAIKKGAYFTIDSDTHSLEGFRSINNAIRIAEDNHIPPERILNTHKKEELNLIYFKR